MKEKLKEFEKAIFGKKIAIIGLGVSNIPLVEYLYNLNCDISIFDKREIKQIDFSQISERVLQHIGIYYGEDYLKNLIGFDYIFRSPSCRLDTKELKAEAQNGAVITTEIEMLISLAPCRVIGVTGSDGKTTTTSLINTILKAGGYTTHLGGNIGIALFTKLNTIRSEDIIVLELSSFQLMDMKVSPNISVITNITPNHLDIHKSYEEYIESKKNIFKNQKQTDILVLSYDNEITRKFKFETDNMVRYFSGKNKITDGYLLDSGIIKYSSDDIRRQVVKCEDIFLNGNHNYENICAALTTTKDLVNEDIAIEAVKDFKGVAHRIEFVRKINGTKWYNDSIGTSPTRTIAGLNAFKEKIVLIAGGYDKKLDYEPLAIPIIENVSKLVLMGATADKIEKAVMIELKKIKKEIPIYHVKTIQEAVNTANDISNNKEIVLFSPASASFDLFKNFEERGNCFKEIVENL